MADDEFTRSPAFQFYTQDFVAGTVTLTTEEVGAYMLLMCHCWDKGAIPKDITLMSRITRLTPKKMQSTWSALASKFRETEGGYIQPRIERERQKQADYRRRQAEASRKRWESQAISQPHAEPIPVDIPEASQRAPKPIPKASSSVFSLQSSSSDFNQEDAPEETGTQESDADLGSHVEPSEVSEFIRRFCELYSKHRFGARYLIARKKHVPIIRNLLRTFDLVRLVKMSTVLLTTTDDWVAGTDRGIGILSVKASFIDGQIAEYEAAHGEIRVAS